MVTGLAALAIGAAGCGGGGEPSELNGLTSLQAATAARDAMDDEVVDPASVARGRTWLIDATDAERFPDGSWAWRVTFLSLEDRAKTVCMWVQLKERTVAREEVEYFLDDCAVPAQS